MNPVMNVSTFIAFTLAFPELRASSNQAPVSFENGASFIQRTFSFIYDLTVFAGESALGASLPERWNFPGFEETVELSLLQNGFLTRARDKAFDICISSRDFISEISQRFNNLSRPFYEPLISSFRSRCPESGRLIGSTLLDILLLIWWLIFVINTTIKLLLAPFRYLHHRKQQRKDKKPFKAIMQSHKRAAITPRSPSPSPTRTDSNEIVRTTKKKIVNE
jgi:hypothetical protein